ncbi:TRIC cation channel family protein [Corynebacterium guangdongense]|uniref:Membrane protein YeiH n=1 Tax=Corynebacterium guangdongense TaxID=1783348 RepID=A0ABU1ZY50_9CORY|nr:TRIC cation channel family protein [Corynebacterium guangdongense]MDR7329864.1 putative membrane protein YeiH [Corynebacterium guangdongense]WJZ18427.1 hypothetical protein CGUA_09340 [Corynebacterium guangdongense]
MNPERLTPEFLENANAYQDEIQNIYQAADLIGVFLMAVVGGTIARHKGYDLVGFFFIALISATGGGMIRDMLIQKGTVAAMAQPQYLVLATVGAIIAWLAHFRGRTWDLIQGHADAVIMGTWAVTGAAKALTWDLPVTAALFMGVITATGGSMMRDVLTGRRPRIFRGEQLMVLPALLAAAVYAAFHYAEEPVLGMIFGAVTGSALALTSYWFGITLPVNPDFAPANAAAEKVEQVADKVGDRALEKAADIEPRSVREIRHEIGIVHKAGEDRSEEKGEDEGSDTQPALHTDSVTAEQDEAIAGRAADNATGYRFEDVLRQLHEDDSELGRTTERAFISEWLAWQEEHRPNQDPDTDTGTEGAGQGGHTRLLERRDRDSSRGDRGSDEAGDSL